MSNKRNAQPAAPTLHTISTSRQDQSQRGVWHYWPILLFVLLSAVSQTVGGLFPG